MSKLSMHDKILSVMSVQQYMEPERITEDIYTAYGDYWKASNTERRLRELAEKGHIQSKKYRNIYNGYSHKRWAKVP